MEEWQMGGKREMRAIRILLIGVFLVVFAVLSFFLSDYFRGREEWRLAILVTMLTVIFAVIAVPVLIFGITLKMKE